MAEEVVKDLEENTCGNSKGVQILLQNIGDPKVLHLTVSLDPLMYCGLVDSVKRLLEKGANVNVQDHQGRTPLHVLVQNKYSDVNSHRSILENELCTLLLNNGANVTLQDEHGQTPLHCAVGCGSQFAALILKSAFGKRALNIPDKLGDYPIHKAVHWSNFFFRTHTVSRLVSPEGSRMNRHGCKTVLKQSPTDHIELLIENGAQIDVQDKKGKTPLHHLVDICTGSNYSWLFHGKVSMLIDWGASCDIKDNSGKLPFSEMVPFDLDTYKPFEFYYAIRKTCLNSPQKIMGLMSQVEKLYGISWVSDSCESYKDDCCIEVEKFKTERIGKNYFYDIFLQISNPKFISNRELLDVVKSKDLEALFPIYKDLLKSTYKVASDRAELLNDAVDVLHAPLPTEVTRYILTFVDTKSLRNVIKAKNIVSQGMEH